LLNKASSDACEVLVIGSGSAALSAVSGAGTGIPANPHTAQAGIQDSAAKALDYIRAASPRGWQETEDDLWVAFVRNAPAVLAFLEKHTPLRFALTEEPGTMAEHIGGKQRGRMLSPLPLRKALEVIMRRGAN
jgi:3-oxosteroid 1-dehydrogenase